jgi:hypothetical protein
MKVQIGSAILYSGKKYIITAAIHTPILIIISPRTCKYAASTLIFLVAFSFEFS